MNKKIIFMIIVTLAFLQIIDATKRAIDKQLLKAVKCNNAGGVELLLAEGANVNIVDSSWSYNNTPLHLAADRNLEKVVELLLAADANTNAVNKLGVTPLYKAVQMGHAKIVKLLLAAGADVNLIGKYGWTPIAVNEEIVQLLIEAGVDFPEECKGYDNTSPGSDLFRCLDAGNLNEQLFEAVQTGNVERIQLLLDDQGVDVNTVDRTGVIPSNYTPLHVAVRNGDAKVVKLLLTAGAKVNIATIDKDGWTLDRGDWTPARDGCTPLYMAAEAGHKEVLESLLDARADANFTIVSKCGRTSPLAVAIDKGNKEIVRLLVYAGADVNIANFFNGETPLHKAAKGGDIKIVEFLLNAGADVNTADKKGWTPLHEAAFGGYIEIVRLLLAAGADVTSITKRGHTPLAITASVVRPRNRIGGQRAIVQLLIRAGADSEGLGFCYQECDPDCFGLYSACRSGLGYCLKYGCILGKLGKCLFLGFDGFEGFEGE